MPRTFALLAALALAAPTLAQPAVDFGLRVGGNLTSLRAEYGSDLLDFNTDREAGFEVAILAITSMTKASVSAELGFARRAYSQTTPVQTGGAPIFTDRRELTLETSFDVGSLAVLGHFFPVGRRPFSPYVLVGPRLDVLLGSDPGSNTYLAGFETALVQDGFPELFADVSLSGVAGLGMEIGRLAGPDLRLEVRYGRTLTDFLSGSDAVDGTINGFDLSVGVTF